MSPDPGGPERDGSEPAGPGSSGPGSSGPGSSGRGPYTGVLHEAASAGRGLLALLAGDPAWVRRFDISAGGFLRSFFGPALALPLYLFQAALITRALPDSEPPLPTALWAAGLAHGFDALGFPLLIALIAKPLRIGKGYAAFVVTTNWASLYLNLMLAAASLLALAGHDGLEAFSLVTLVLLCLSVFFVWRAGRATLSHEFAPILLVVVLSVAVSAVADQAASYLLSLT